MKTFSPLPEIGGFHARLIAQSAEARAAFQALPILGEAVQGRVSREDYIAFLIQAYHHVRHTTPLLMACGSRLPVFQVQGRSDDLLQLRNGRGSVVKILPLALDTALEENAGLPRFQIIQTGADCLQVRLQDPQDRQVCEQVLTRYLQEQGITGLKIEHDRHPPQVELRSGKLRRVLYRPAKARRPTRRPAPDMS
jgi:hypothetical protein